MRPIITLSTLADKLAHDQEQLDRMAIIGAPLLAMTLQTPCFSRDDVLALDAVSFGERLVATLTPYAPVIPSIQRLIERGALEQICRANAICAVDDLATLSPPHSEVLTDYEVAFVWEACRRQWGGDAATGEAMDDINLFDGILHLLFGRPVEDVVEFHFAHPAHGTVALLDPSSDGAFHLPSLSNLRLSPPAPLLPSPLSSASAQLPSSAPSTIVQDGSRTSTEVAASPQIHDSHLFSAHWVSGATASSAPASPRIM